MISQLVMPGLAVFGVLVIIAIERVFGGGRFERQLRVVRLDHREPFATVRPGGRPSDDTDR